jgi:hypothetical protein
VKHGVENIIKLQGSEPLGIDQHILLEQYFENKPHLQTIFFMSSISIYVA